MANIQDTHKARQGKQATPPLPPYPLLALAPYRADRAPRFGDLHSDNSLPANRITAFAGKAPKQGVAPPQLSLASPPDRLNVVAGAVAGAVLDTTAQPHHTTQRSLWKRAKRKAWTEAVVEGLVALGTGTPLRYAYQSTLSCGSLVKQEDGKLSARYCCQRWCRVCNSIRSAKLYSAYAPALAGWTDAYFVTLTCPNVPAPRLVAEVALLTKAMPAIAKDMARTDRLTLTSLRKLEVTYNPTRKDFHPHFHLVVKGKVEAETLVRRWLEYFPDANAGAQKVIACAGDGVAGELFKYLTKDTVTVDGKERAIPSRALDTIYKAVKRRRTIQPTGALKAVKVGALEDADGALELDTSTSAPSRRTKPCLWSWVTSLTDWVDYDTGEVLAGYDPSPADRATLQRLRAESLLDDLPAPPADDVVVTSRIK